MRTSNGVAAAGRIGAAAPSMGSRALAAPSRRRVPPSIPYQIDLSTSKTGR
eukprot:CAMPEP_0197715676 /NCGR_PEP_ID=MMETSP1434-20131217/793_1 /TAXON_ID=265543 /ORGANISM="Minutocellus polymorphus, Strain CCMP3303" /LENGTH=50 /DNA_ID=CAMNT_0043299867 /DNA_START=14 /DNA_END=166 /DNA_ORIENTATION=-